ncbi:Mor transcription activator family protein [Thiocystis violascens]|nr:Mor transcription activator family protein [Thiocystis violascens]
MTDDDLFPDLLRDLPAAALDTLADDPARWPAVLAGLSDYVLDELLTGLPATAPALARRLAYRVVARIMREHGGTQLYIPKGDAVLRALRDLEIWSRYDGTVDGPGGLNALARRHGLSAARVRVALRRQRDLHRARVQPDLFAGL